MTTANPADIARSTLGNRNVFCAGPNFLVDSADHQDILFDALAAAGYNAEKCTAKFPGRPMTKRAVRVTR